MQIDKQLSVCRRLETPWRASYIKLMWTNIIHRLQEQLADILESLEQIGCGFDETLKKEKVWSMAENVFFIILCNILNWISHALIGIPIKNCQ